MLTPKHSSSVPAEVHESNDVDVLAAFLEDMRAKQSDLAQDFESLDQPHLFHYTDLEGLRGFVTDLPRLTHARYMNDEREMSRGYEIAERVISEAKTERTDGGWQTYLERVQERLSDRAFRGVYVCCFCQDDGDRLSQWRSYGGGAGVSIKVNLNHVYKHDRPCGGLMRPWKVYYDTKTPRQILRSAIGFVFDRPQPVTLTHTQRALQAAEIIEFFLPTFKHRGFEEEKEWRLIFTPSFSSEHKPKFRTARGLLIPYFSLKELYNDSKEPFGWPLITGVRVGPSVHQQSNVQSANMLLEQHGYGLISAERSDIPYRG